MRKRLRPRSRREQRHPDQKGIPRGLTQGLDETKAYRPDMHVYEDPATRRANRNRADMDRAIAMRKAEDEA